MRQKIKGLFSYLKQAKSKRELLSFGKMSAPPEIPFKGTGVVYRVAVIGAGAMGRDQCLGLQTIKQVQIVAVADINPDALERLRQQVDMPTARFYTDPEKMLKTEQFDLVCIATNTISHISIAEMAVKAGVPRLIVEKPIGNQVVAARRLAQLCSERGIKLAVNQSRRWSGDYAAIKRCIQHGYIGPLRQIYVVPGPGGMAMIGVHYLDLIAYLADSKIGWVIGFLDEGEEPNRRGSQYRDPGGYSLVGLENGTRGYLDTSRDLNRKDKFMVLRGDAGRIEVDERKGEWHLINDNFERQTFSFMFTTKPSGYFAKVATEILSDAPPSCGALEGIAALEAVMAIHISNSQGHSQIFLPLKGSDAELELSFP